MPVTGPPDWPSYADGATRTVTRGTDFNSSPVGFVQSGSAWARRNSGLMSYVILEPDQVIFRIMPLRADDPAAVA